MGNPPRVLVVEDNAAMLARATTVLGTDCVVVGAVTDGPAALQAADALRPDVIVLDISMPGLSGLDVAFYLRRVGSSAAIVFLTMHEGEEFVLAATAAGGLGYVVKSRLMFDLLNAVREANNGRAFVSPRR